MEMSAKMVVMSHLSNAQEEIGFMVGSSAIESINFAKYVIIETKGNLNQDIDADAMYTKFLAMMRKRKEFDTKVAELDVNI
jgi:hypothetical protein